MSIQRLFENDNWVVVDKPSGWLTTPARAKEDPRPCLGLHLQKEMGRRIFPVHRLDFEVSGLVLFALNAESHRKASSWFEQSLVVKTYRAETAPGSEAPREWQKWRCKLLRGKKRSYVSPHGAACVTEARVVETLPESWRWELRPLTGKPHQLRVELANHGAPILGDVLYGGPAGEKGAIALRAVTLNFSNVTVSDRGGLPEQLGV